MLKKDFILDVKSIGDEGVFEGYASTFGGSPDSYGDIVAPGAFAESLVAHKRAGTMPGMFFGHDTSTLPIGDWLELSEDGKGLKAKGQIELDDEFGARVHLALKKKRVRGLSIGYSIPSGGSERDEKLPGVTILKKINLVEVSVVNNPANKRSLVADVKSILDGGALPTVREFEEFLRDAGFSKALATAIAGKATPHLRGDPEAKADDVQKFIAALRT